MLRVSEILHTHSLPGLLQAFFPAQAEVAGQGRPHLHGEKQSP